MTVGIEHQEAFVRTGLQGRGVKCTSQDKQQEAQKGYRNTGSVQKEANTTKSARQSGRSIKKQTNRKIYTQGKQGWNARHKVLRQSGEDGEQHRTVYTTNKAQVELIRVGQTITLGGKTQGRGGLI